MINGGFLAAMNVLGLIKGVVAAGLLGGAAYGVWGLIGVTSAVVFGLGAVGIEDKYIQQDEPDQEVAFQAAFTLQCGLALVAGAAILGAMPLFSLAYGRPEMIAPGMSLALAMPALALQSPLWIFWRRMDFLRQRSLQIWDPVVSLIAVVVLALAGLGVWALVLGSLAGSYAAALAAVRASPYPLRLRYRPGALREYASFSWPLFVASMSVVLVGLIPVVVASRTLGLAAVGAITLAYTIGQFAYRLDDLLTEVLYPAICAVKDQGEVLFAMFFKSNRLALLWALPSGVAAALFAGDFVHYVIGEEWRFAVPLIQIIAMTAAINQVGFNWTAFYRALGRTRPIALANGALLAAVLAVAVPLLVTNGLNGYAIGMAVATGLFLAVRLFLLVRIFPTFQVVAHVGRAFLPTLWALVATLAVHSAGAAGSGRSLGQVLAEVVVFVTTTLGVTLISERELVREVRDYLRGSTTPEPVRA